MMDRYAPTMRQRIDADAMWRSARDQAMLAYEGAKQERASSLPLESPFSLDDLLVDRIDVMGLEQRLRQGIASRD